MKMNKIMLGMLALTVTILTVGPKLVQAYKGDPKVQGPNYSVERHEIVSQALANNDYNSWKEQMQGRGVTNKVNEANFAQFAKAHNLALEGKTEEANAIRAELGLGLKNGTGSKNGGRGQNMANCPNLNK